MQFTMFWNSCFLFPSAIIVLQLMTIWSTVYSAPVPSSVAKWSPSLKEVFFPPYCEILWLNIVIKIAFENDGQEIFVVFNIHLFSIQFFPRFLGWGINIFRGSGNSYFSHKVLNCVIQYLPGTLFSKIWRHTVLQGIFVCVNVHIYSIKSVMLCCGCT